MFPTITSTLTADEKISRLVKQTSLNLSMHMRRLAVLTDNFTRAAESFEGAQRDYLISLLYTINETLAIMHFIGSQEHMDAIFLANLDARDYYNEAVNIVHEGIMKDETVKPLEEIYEAELVRLQPELKQPMPDELGDDVALNDTDREKLKGEPGLNAMAGEPGAGEEEGLDYDVNAGINNSDERRDENAERDRRYDEPEQAA